MTKKMSREKLSELFIRAKQGDSEAFALIYKETSAIQYYLAVKNTHDHAMAQDIVQELYIKLFTKIENIENPELLVAYLNRMNYNLSIDFMKKNNKEISLDLHDELEYIVDKNASFEKDFENESLISSALSQLENELREIVILRYMDGLKTKEIASLLNVSTRTVERKIKKSLKLLKEICKKNDSKAFAFGIFGMSYYVNQMDRSIYEMISRNRLEKIYPSIERALQENSIFEKNVEITNIGKSFFSSLLQHALLKNVLISGSIITISSSVILSPPIFNVNNKINSNFVEYEVAMFAHKNAKKITVYDENGNNLMNVENESKVNFKIMQNGEYVIEVEGENNQIGRKKIIVDNFDEEYPKLIDYSYIEGKVEISFKDEDGKIDYSSLVVYTASNEPVDFEIIASSETQCRIMFYIDENVRIRIKDNVGNEVVANIDLKTINN